MRLLVLLKYLILSFSDSYTMLTAQSYVTVLDIFYDK